MTTTPDLTPRRTTAAPPADTEPGATDGRAAPHRGRAVALGFVVGCLVGSSVAWAVSDGGGGGPSASTPDGGASRPAVVMSADAAEHRAAERRDDCRTLGTADAVARCLDAPSGPVG